MSKGVQQTATIEPRGAHPSLAELAILGLLHEQPMHGYEIARRFADDLDLGLVLPLELSTVYAVLKDLQARALIHGERETAGRYPPRTVFALVAGAETGFLRWLQEPVERLREVRSALLVKLYFCDRLDPRRTAHLIAAQIDASRAYLDRLVAQEQAAAAGSFAQLVFESKIAAAQATIVWIERRGNMLASESRR
jgi:DNA-binding PadR family transcriptional regulator